jgi:hypothetical protein
MTDNRRSGITENRKEDEVPQNKKHVLFTRMKPYLIRFIPSLSSLDQETTKRVGVGCLQ